jgi:hypothetical protein
VENRVRGGGEIWDGKFVEESVVVVCDSISESLLNEEVIRNISSEANK